MIDSVWTGQEAAQWLGVAPETLYRALGRGEVPGRKVGREWRLSVRQLAEWVNGEPVNELPELLSPQQAAQHLRVSLPRFYALLAGSEIHSRRVGRRWFVTKSAVERWLSQPS